MHYVYLLKSEAFPSETYIGLTADLQARIKKHNEGGCSHTSKYKHGIWLPILHSLHESMPQISKPILNQDLEGLSPKNDSGRSSFSENEYADIVLEARRVFTLDSLVKVKGA